MGQIDLELERLSNDEKKVVFFSMSGYSLGGRKFPVHPEPFGLDRSMLTVPTWALVPPSRCSSRSRVSHSPVSYIYDFSPTFLSVCLPLSILHARDPSFFTNVKPLCFSTFASPWLGMPRYNTLFNSFATTVGSKMLSRTGAQLFVTDEEQLVVRLAGKGKLQLPNLAAYDFGLELNLSTCTLDDVFMQALMLFSKIDIYANAVRISSLSLVDSRYVMDVYPRRKLTIDDLCRHHAGP
jgi:hypothetical protein